MLCIPVLYSTYAYQRASKQSQAALKVTLVPTQFPASELSNPQNFVRIIEETLHRSDSLAFYMADIGQFSDLYLWPETGVPYQLAYSNLGSLLFEAVSDWQGALLTGCRGVPGIQDTLDKRTYVSGVLLSHKNSAPEFHHKTILTPGHEVIPYHHWLARIPGFPVAETSPGFIGKEPKPSLWNWSPAMPASLMSVYRSASNSGTLKSGPKLHNMAQIFLCIWLARAGTETLDSRLLWPM